MSGTSITDLQPPDDIYRQPQEYQPSQPQYQPVLKKNNKKLDLKTYTPQKNKELEYLIITSLTFIIGTSWYSFVNDLFKAYISSEKHQMIAKGSFNFFLTIVAYFVVRKFTNK